VGAPLAVHASTRGGKRRDCRFQAAVISEKNMDREGPFLGASKTRIYLLTWRIKGKKRRDSCAPLLIPTRMLPPAKQMLGEREKRRRGDARHKGKT